MGEKGKDEKWMRPCLLPALERPLPGLSFAFPAQANAAEQLNLSGSQPRSRVHRDTVFFLCNAFSPSVFALLGLDSSA